jgi:hypothetical protein
MYTDRETVESKGDFCSGVLIVERLECCKVEMLKREANTFSSLKY